MRKSRTKESRVDAAIQRIEKLTGTRVRKQHLFIESRWVNSSRLKLATQTNGTIASLIRLPDHYWWAHSGLAFALSFSALLFAMEGVQQTWGAAVAALIAAAGGYGVTAWHNRKAEQSNPILSFDSATQLLRGSALRGCIDHEDICFLTAISSVHATAQKPETSSSELKLIFCSNGSIRSSVVAKGGNRGEQGYDKEIRPFVEKLRTKLLHVNRPMDSKPIAVSLKGEWPLA